jgi:putative transposase
MADYRRAAQPGGTFFFTIVTHRRQPLFADAGNVERLRAAVLAVMNERPFNFLAGVVLPDHAHYLWTLPPGDGDFSTRIGRMKVLFTKSLVGWAPPTTSRSESRIKHRDADIWQRRFWEHTIRDQDDLNRHLDYIHYNPVKHGLTMCPHAWPTSSFDKWVANARYDRDWCCQCNGRTIDPPDFSWASDDME